MKENAYRVLRISANASLSDIRKAATSIRRSALLGLKVTTGIDLPEFSEIPCTEAEIRAAIGRLENPKQRIKDRLFWFHRPPKTGETDLTTNLGSNNETAKNHDNALYGLIDAHKASFNDSGILVWIDAVRNWHMVVENDEYWSLILAIEEQGGFEPTVLIEEVNTLRSDATELGAAPLIIAAREALAHQDNETIHQITAALEELADTGAWADRNLKDIFEPVCEHFLGMCRSISADFDSRIIREPNVGELNKKICDSELDRFRNEIEPELERIIQFLPTKHYASKDIREGAAFLLNGIASNYTWADDFITSEKLKESALKLAQDTLGVIRIEDGLEQIKVAAGTQRIFGELKPISSAPSLSTINGFGFTLYGKSNYDEATQSYITTRYFVALAIPIFPIARYRVINLGNQFQFLGKLPFRLANYVHLGIAIAALAALLYFGPITWTNETRSNVYSPSESSSSTVSENKNSRLSDIKAQIDNGRARISMLEKKLQPVTNEISSLNTKMQTLKADLKSLDEQHNNGVQIDTDDYNVKVDTYNALLAKYKEVVATNSAEIKAHDDLIEQDSALVNQYNAILNGGAQ